MRRALWIGAAVGLAVPVAAVAAAHWALGGDAVRERLVASVQHATGRTLTIAGPVRIGWSLTPTIELRDVSLSNPPGFSRPTMAHVGRIEASFALVPLLSRRVALTRLLLAAPDLALERDAQGRPNWRFAEPVPAAAPSTSSAPAGERFVLDLGKIDIEDATLAWLGPAPVTLAAPRLSYEPATGAVSGTLSVRDVAVAVDGKAGPASGGLWPLALHIAGGGLDATLSGTSQSLGVSLHAADLAALSPLAGRDLPPLQNMQLDGALGLMPGGASLTGFRLSSAQGDLSGDLTLTNGPKPALRGTLASTRLDLDALGPRQPPQPAPAPAAPAPPAPEPAARLVPDIPIPFDTLRRADADLQIHVHEATYRGRALHDVIAHLVLQDGKLALDPASADLGGKRTPATLHADAAAQTVAIKLDGAALPAAALITGAAGALDLHLDVHGQGTTLRALLATLGGQAGLALVDGEIDNTWLQGVLVAAHLPIEAGGRSKLRCAAVRADAEGGRVQFRALSLDTTKLKLDGSGTIDLADEALDLHLTPELRLGTALSVPVRVRGTMAAPKVTLDPGAIAPGRVGIVIGGPAPADSCGPALALARGGEPGASPQAAQPAKPPKPADLLRQLLR